MRTQIFQDLFERSTSGRNMHICAAQPSSRVQDPAFSLSIGNGRSVRAGRFRAAEEPLRKQLRIRASAFPKYRLCTDRIQRMCAGARTERRRLRALTLTKADDGT